MSADLLLLSTTDLGSGRGDQVVRMLESVSAFRQAHPQVRVRHLFLFQNAAAGPLPTLPEWVEADSCEGVIPLSAARNRMLARIDLGDCPPNAVVAIPDDDCWYPEGTLAFMRELISASDAVDLAFCRYDPAPHGPDDAIRPRAATLQQAISFASSTTIFLRASLAREIGTFAEDLGLGTPLGGGEDTDYAMRAWHASRASLFVPAGLVGHRAMDAQIKARYFKGSFAAIRRNQRLSFQAKAAFLRKAAVGLLGLARGKIGWGDLLSGQHISASRQGNA